MATGKPVTAPDDISAVFDIRPSDINEMRGMAETMFEDHYQEIALHKESMELDINWKRFYALEEQNAVVCLAAWLGCDMVGYSVNIIYPHMHYQGTLVCHNDVLYVAPDQRGGGLGQRLIEATEDMGRKRGCHVIQFHSKPGKDLDEIVTTKLKVDGAVMRLLTALGRLLGIKGYQIQDIMHSRLL